MTNQWDTEQQLVKNIIVIVHLFLHLWCLQQWQFGKKWNNNSNLSKTLSSLPTAKDLSCLWRCHLIMIYVTGAAVPTCACFIVDIYHCLLWLYNLPRLGGLPLLSAFVVVVLLTQSLSCYAAVTVTYCCGSIIHSPSHCHMLLLQCHLLWWYCYSSHYNLLFQQCLLW